MRQLTNPVLIRERRRDIARLNTVLAELKKAQAASGAPAESKEKKA
jgi:ribosomal protein L29